MSLNSPCSPSVSHRSISSPVSQILDCVCSSGSNIRSVYSTEPIMQYWSTSIFVEDFSEQDPKLRKFAWNQVLMLDWHTSTARTHAEGSQFPKWSHSALECLIPQCQPFRPQVTNKMYSRRTDTFLYLLILLRSYLVVFISIIYLFITISK